MPFELSIVLPAYNEARVLGRTLERAAAFARSRQGEVVVVDDGSSDSTRAIAEACARRYPEVQVVARARNGGKGAAVRSGVLAARGRYVAYTDADLVYSLEQLDGFVQALAAGADLAIGSRSHEASLFALNPRHFPYIYQRHVVGRVFVGVVNRVLDLGVNDTQCGLKCLRAEAARELFGRLTLDDFGFDVEMLYVARRLGYRVVELPVHLLYAGEGSSVDLVRDSLRMLRDIFAVRARGRRGAYDRAPQPSEHSARRA